MKLDFLVIGAQKAGTTSLWRYLRGHPSLCMPRSKEAPAFTASADAANRLEGYMRAHLAHCAPSALRGKVTPDYMVGSPEAPVDVVAGRIATLIPGVKLIALLRDPIDRAISAYLMALRRGQEHRPLDEALSDLLEPSQLDLARRQPSPTNSYLAAGEYGRMLNAYLDHFAEDDLLVLFTHELDASPGSCLDHVLDFLGLPTGYRPEDLAVRHFRGGSRPLIDGDAEQLLFKFFDEEILPHMAGSPAMHRKAFEFFYATWNVAPDDTPPVIAPQLRARLEEHFAADAEFLPRIVHAAPWLGDWARIQPERADVPEGGAAWQGHA